MNSYNINPSVALSLLNIIKIPIIYFYFLQRMSFDGLRYAIQFSVSTASVSATSLCASATLVGKEKHVTKVDAHYMAMAIEIINMLISKK